MRFSQVLLKSPDILKKYPVLDRKQGLFTDVSMISTPNGEKKMTAVKQLKPIDTSYVEKQMSNIFQYEGDLPQTITAWGDYLKQFDVSLKEDLPLNIEYFDSLSKTNSINELWKDLVTEHPLSHQIQKSLASLTPMQKQIIHLSYWEGLSLRAIGKEMKMSKSNVLKQRDKAIKRLKHEISKHVDSNTNSVHKI